MSLITRCDCDDCYNMDTNYDKEIYYVTDKAREILGDCGFEHCCLDCWESYIANEYPSLHIDKENWLEQIDVKG